MFAAQNLYLFGRPSVLESATLADILTTATHTRLHMARFTYLEEAITQFSNTMVAVTAWIPGNF